MAEGKLLSLSDLLAGGSLKTKLLQILPDALSETHKNDLLQEIGEGKAVKEVHTKAGFKDQEPRQFEKRKCIRGSMILPEDGDWLCFAIWKTDDKLYQGTFKMKVDPDPSKTRMSLDISSPPGTNSTSFTVLDVYLKYDYDSHLNSITIAGEFGVSYRDTKDQIRTLMFTTKPNKIVGL